MALDGELVARPLFEAGTVALARQKFFLLWISAMTSPTTPPFPAPFRLSSDVEVCPIHCFSITAKADPSVLPRLLDMIAMFNLIPERCHVSRSDQEPGRPLMIDLQLSGLEDAEVHLIEKKLERMVLVTQILCSEKRQAAA